MPGQNESTKKTFLILQLTGFQRQEANFLAKEK